ncbi:DUF5690 family protein [Chondrinema litorale]|uniref:DUF5690 family protein n=1 Tax=Chondrinema litorale TaxID=2994555 RepID=UPI002543160E|nr:DUF5690 family protein [Chondrinema litorale]UZR93559.1 DUF5690 family protein [Chondrinema litorale]
MNLNKSVTQWLSKTKLPLFTLFAVLAAFCTYSCMYAFRKPFAVATFEGIAFWGIDYKILLIVAQVLGYTLSKFLGIKIVSEAGTKIRGISILVLIGLAEIALLGFALTPAPYNIIFLFFNGLPLGMVWGLVFSYLEGRRVTEILGAGLSISFIFSSGFVKTIGAIVMQDWGFTEFWMPFITGGLFAFPLLFFVWMLERLPAPSALDEELRTKREPMNGKQRKQLFLGFAPGLILLIIVYALLTAFRDFRDNFAAEIWQAVGYGDSPEIFTATEIPISLAILIMMSLVFLVKDNAKALMVNHLIIFAGIVLVGLSTMAYQNSMIGPELWMILVGLGLYMGYVPFNSIFFDRFIAAFQYISNVGFLIYLADAFGYMGSVGIMLYKNFGNANMSWLNFFISSSYIMAVVGAVFTLLSMYYFAQKHKAWKQDKMVVSGERLA